MSTFIILFAQTKIGATIEIISLLLVSAIIGYITAWQYFKVKYKRKLKIIEGQRDELRNINLSLNKDQNRLQNSIHEDDIKIKSLNKEINTIMALNNKAFNETDNKTYKYTRLEQMHHDKDNALKLIAQRKHLLDYNSFGYATSSEVNDLKMISGIGPFIEERLHALDIFTFLQISKFTAEDILAINITIEYFSGRIERDEWVAQAKELVRDIDKKNELIKRISERKSHIYRYSKIKAAKKEEADDLTIISGIGGWIQEKLNALDIYTFQQISMFDSEDIHLVTEAIEYFPGRIERDEWIHQAQELVTIAGKKSDLILRIIERKNRIYFDRLGIAHKFQANNLTLIKGIGLWMEERLNMLDIYTFEQISNLTPADVEIISEILEISPSRIEKDNWIQQANVFKKIIE